MCVQCFEVLLRDVRPFVDEEAVAGKREGGFAAIDRLFVRGLRRRAARERRQDEQRASQQTPHLEPSFPLPDRPLEGIRSPTIPAQV